MSDEGTPISCWENQSDDINWDLLNNFMFLVINLGIL